MTGAVRTGVEAADVETAGPVTAAAGEGGAIERIDSLALAGLPPATAPLGVDRMPLPPPAAVGSGSANRPGR